MAGMRQPGRCFGQPRSLRGAAERINDHAPRARTSTPSWSGRHPGGVGLQPAARLEQGRDRPDAAHAGDRARLGRREPYDGAERARRHRLPAPLLDRFGGVELRSPPTTPGPRRWRSTAASRPTARPRLRAPGPRRLRQRRPRPRAPPPATSASIAISVASPPRPPSVAMRIASGAGRQTFAQQRTSPRAARRAAAGEWKTIRARAGSGADRAMLNLPNLLTLFRILLVPILVVVLLTKVDGKEFVGLASSCSPR